MNIAIDDLDLPISKDYLRQIEKVGGKIVCQSKWLKTVCVKCEVERLIDEYKRLTFVEDVVKVWRSEKGNQKLVISLIKFSVNRSVTNYSSEDYGET